MHIGERPPSSAWEAVPLADDPHSIIWAWFRPPAAAFGFVVRIPNETFQGYARRRPLTMRNLLAAVGVAPQWLAMWSLYGVPYDGGQGTNPALDAPIPLPAGVVDPTIVIYLHPTPDLGMAAVPPIFAPMAEPSAFGGQSAVPSSLPVAGSTAGASDELFARMEVAWNASLQLELQLAAAAKQLNGTLLRLGALNRDLSSEEGRYADQQDKREWNDARRWLRDMATRLQRFLKDHHIGITSAAGKRNTYETVYKQQVVPRRPFEGIVQMEREYEAYRKTMQTLLNNMNTVQGAAVQDGERRAQLVLTRISAKVRAARTKRG
ncbi:MAG: hypothetical protein ACKV0T_10195 [Planctomycetales bacterium]